MDEAKGGYNRRWEVDWSRGQCWGVKWGQLYLSNNKKKKQFTRNDEETSLRRKKMMKCRNKIQRKNLTDKDNDLRKALD